MIKHLYIHIPFCDSICSYCDFNKRVSNNKIMFDYLCALKREIDEYKEEIKNIETIFIGGGTPTAFPYLEELLDSLSKYINLNKIIEFTIESTPDTVLNYLDIYKKYNVNRISIGIESLNKDTLNYINRKELDSEKLKNIINKLRNVCIKSINLDFIKGLPFESIESINKTLDVIKEINVDHVSFYDLIVEEKTKLFYDLNHFIVTLPSESLLMKMDKIVNDKLEKMGLIRYEVSNYSKIGFESIHNKSYWLLENYLGLGVNSHSFINGRRFYNTSNLFEYLKDYKTKSFKNNVIEEDCDLEQEFIILGLRLTKGISLSEYAKKFNKDFLIKYNFIYNYIEMGLLKLEGDNLMFTYDGFNVMNKVLEEFL